MDAGLDALNAVLEHGLQGTDGSFLFLDDLPNLIYGWVADIAKRDQSQVDSKSVELELLSVNVWQEEGVSHADNHMGKSKWSVFRLAQ